MFAHTLGTCFPPEQYSKEGCLFFYLLYVFSQGLAKVFGLDLNLFSCLGRHRIFCPPAYTTRLSSNPACEKYIDFAVSSCHDSWAQNGLDTSIKLFIPHYQLCTKAVYSGKSQPPALSASVLKKGRARGRLWNWQAVFYRNELQNQFEMCSVTQQRLRGDFDLTIRPLRPPSFLPLSTLPLTPAPLLLLHSSAHKPTHRLEIRERIWVVLGNTKEGALCHRWRIEQGWLQAPVSLE